MKLIPYGIGFILGVLACFFVLNYFHAKSLAKMEQEKQQAIAVQIELCNNQKTITEAIDEKTTTAKANNCTTYINALKRMQQKSRACVSIAGNTCNNYAATREEQSGCFEQRFDAEYRAAQNAVTLEGAQEFICKTWIQLKQPVPKACERWKN
jgi:hypothetical protein